MINVSYDYPSIVMTSERVAWLHAQVEMFGDHQALRALMRFADEELKHQQLFQRYRDAFDRGFGHAVEVHAKAVSGSTTEPGP